MGYTHYWKRERVIDPATFRRIASDCRRIILPLHDKGVSLAGPLGKGVAEITDDRVAFNGVADCGHPSYEEIAIPHPDDNAWRVGDASNAVSGHAFMHTLLRHRACDGNCSYETFTFDRVQQARFADDSEASCSEYCKTGFRPYDLAVQCFLLYRKTASAIQDGGHLRRDGTALEGSAGLLLHAPRLSTGGVPHGSRGRPDGS